ncbi:MAG: ATP-binding protein [bacterium]
MKSSPFGIPGPPAGEPGGIQIHPHRVALIYALAGVLWILVTDRVVGFLFPGIDSLKWAQTVKGLAYVGATALLVYWLARRAVSDARARWMEGQLRDALDLSEARHRALVDAIPDLVWLKAPSGVYLGCNPTFERFFGASEREIIGKTDEDFMDGDLAQFFRGHDRRALAADGPVTNEEWLTFADTGYRGLFETIKTPMRDPAGNLIGVLGISRDITRRTELEQQLQQAQKMESVGRLAGGLAHDFNNMLGVILGNTEMALEGLDQSDPLRDHLAAIHRAGRRSADLTRQLLAFARKQTIEPVVLDLNGAVTSLVKMIGRMMREDITLTWQPAEGLPPVRMDPAQVDQILVNLVVNARDAILGAGTITIRTERVDVTGDRSGEPFDVLPGRYVVLAVKDDGPGMDRETRNKIFEPFFTTKALGEGTGLGLPMVYGVVKQNGGFIQVESGPGAGTDIRIFLPAHEGPVEVGAETVEAAGIRGGADSILLVEDEPLLLELGQRILRGLGYQVEATADPLEALEAIRGNPGRFGLLLTDVVMPRMSGHDLWIQVREIDTDVRCLFMSGHASDVLDLRVGPDTGVHFIQKPFTIRTLGDKVREVLEDPA